MTDRRDGDVLRTLDVERTVIRIVKPERRLVGVANRGQIVVMLLAQFQNKLLELQQFSIEIGR